MKLVVSSSSSLLTRKNDKVSWKELIYVTKDDEIALLDRNNNLLFSKVLSIKNVNIENCYTYYTKESQYFTVIVDKNWQPIYIIEQITKNLEPIIKKIENIDSFELDGVYLLVEIELEKEANPIVNDFVLTNTNTTE